MRRIFTTRRLIVLAAVVAVLGVAYYLVAPPGQRSVATVPFEPKGLVDYHKGYWVAKLSPSWSPISVIAINDLHVDPQTNRVTVYAQARAFGNVVAPAQVGPGECTENDGETVCFHPNAVYLNGSGQELTAADGTGASWIKHSWVLGGEGYENCELKPAETYECLWAEGTLLEDGLTMKIGGIGKDGAEHFNTRLPVIRAEEVTYLATRFGPTYTDPDSGEVDLDPMVLGGVTLECQEEPSAFNGETIACPSLMPTQQSGRE